MSTDLFGVPDVLLRFSPSELDILRRPIVGDPMGGHQQFLAALTKRLDALGSLVVSDRELQKARTYAGHNGGSGGYQGRFKVLVSAARRAGWVEP